MIDAAAWNALLEKIAYARPLTFVSEGSTLARHPWEISPAFNYERKRWECFVEAGYVNGEDVEVSVVAEDAPADTRERLEGSKAETLRAWLSEDARLVLGATRVVGRGSGATGVTPTDGGGFVTTHEAVPLFFRSLGVGEADPFEISGEGEGAELPDPAAESKPSPILRACDVVLRKPRAGTQTQWTETVNGLQLEILNTFTAETRKRAFLYTTPRFVAPAETAPLAKLLGEVADNPFDDLHIGTVFLVSPAGADAATEPDDTWTPYAQNLVFWNLAHKSRAFDLLPQQPLMFPLPLAGGAGQPLVNQILALFNTAQAQLTATLSKTDATGAFWTT
jgi:hypothetical protein